ISSPEVADARAAVTSLSARAKAARENAERLKRLGDKGLASAQEVATAAADANALEADEAAARQRLSVFGIDPMRTGAESSRLEPRAPIDGYVLKRDGVSGQVVESGHEIASIADFDRAFFLSRLFEKDLAQVEPGAGADVRLNAYPSVVFPGKVDSIGRQIDPQTRTVLARIAVQDQNSRLKAGLFGVARVVTKAPAGSQPQIVVPFEAVTRVGGDDIVFAEQRIGEFKVHRVVLGRTASGKVEVLSGLKRGERVAVSGVFALKSVLLKGTFGEQED
ncbi:MAG: efflux RND transporter periplasmic adaptor subunit, partial [Candidatus Binataceae bacterium]